MVFFIDDDFAALQSWLAELELRNLPVNPIRTADQAFRVLWDASPEIVSLVVIDVMLAVEDIYDPRFSASRTNEYLETGLRLLEDLADQNPAVFPARAVLLSNTANEVTYRHARAVSQRFDVPFWGKMSVISPVEFADRVVARIRDVDARVSP